MICWRGFRFQIPSGEDAKPDSEGLDSFFQAKGIFFLTLLQLYNIQNTKL